MNETKKRDAYRTPLPIPDKITYPFYDAPWWLEYSSLRKSYTVFGAGEQKTVFIDKKLGYLKFLSKKTQKNLT